jgi:hypothetical protein
MTAVYTLSYYVFIVLVFAMVFVVSAMGYLAKESYQDFQEDCPYCAFSCP